VASDVTKTQVDKLGDRLKKGDIPDDDLRRLDEYRRSFFVAYEFVVAAIRSELSLEPTGRPANRRHLFRKNCLGRAFASLRFRTSQAVV